MIRVERSLAGISLELRKSIRSVVAGESPWPLVMLGREGTGKTCAALCLLDYAGGSYFTATGLCNLLIQSQQGRLEWSHLGRGGAIWPEQFLAKVATEPLVVLDEIGCRDRVSDHHYECVKQLIDERACRPFVVISNLTLEKIAELYDHRISSRLAAGTVVVLDGQDRRLDE